MERDDFTLKGKPEFLELMKDGKGNKYCVIGGLYTICLEIELCEGVYKYKSVAQHKEFNKWDV